MPNTRPLQSLVWYWQRPGPFPMRMTLVMPFALAPLGVVLSLVGLLGGRHLLSVFALGFTLAWSGLFAAIPCALYLLFAWAVIRPQTDRQLLWTVLIAPPICGVISEVLENVFATGSLLPNEGTEFFFFKAATGIGYLAALMVILAYAVRVLRERTRARVP